MNRDWMNRARCRNYDPELFFPSVNGPAARKQIAEAIEICKQCPVIAECAAERERTDSTYGVWAAKMHRADDKKLGASPSVEARQYEHGSEAGYKRHLRRGETSCAACRQAATKESVRRQQDRRRSA